MNQSLQGGAAAQLTKVSNLKACEEQKLRRGELHTDAVRHAVGGSSHRLATWAASRLPTAPRDRHHVV